MIPDIAGPVLLFAGAAAVSFIHLRHAGLWGLVLAAPALLLLPVAGLVWIWAPGLLAVLPLVWLWALVLLLLYGDECALGILDGAAPGSAVRTALHGRWVPLLAATLATASVLGLAAGQPLTGGLMALAVIMAGAGLGVVMLAGRFSYGETFIARSNRMREVLQRGFDTLIAVARPRWGYAVAGIALVFAVLSGFGLRPLTLAPEIRAQGAVLLAGGGAALGLAAVAAIRDWRVILSCLLVLALCGTVGLWALTLALTKLVLSPVLGLSFLCVFGAGAVLLLAACAQAARYGRDGDDATIAAARTFVRMGPGLFLAAAAAVTGLLLWAVVAGPAALALAAMMGFAGAGVLIFQPALAVVIESWFPRPATLAARYRLG